MAELTLVVPPRPDFQTASQERLHRKQRLAAAFRLFARYGFDEGVAGHITARDPEKTDHFWVNPFGMYFGHIRASDLLLVNHDGDVVEGKHPVNAAAFAIHSQVHAARPDVVAAAHAHSMYGKSWSSLGRSCHAQLLAEAAGKPVKIDSEQARLTRSQVGSEVAGWFSFQPLYEKMVRE